VPGILPIGRRRAGCLSRPVLLKPRMISGSSGHARVPCRPVFSQSWPSQIVPTGLGKWSSIRDGGGRITRGKTKMRRRLESRANGSVSLHVSRCRQGPRQATLPRRDERGCHARPTSSPTSPCWRGEYKGEMYNSSQSSGGRIAKSRRGWVLSWLANLAIKAAGEREKTKDRKWTCHARWRDMFGRGFWTAGDAYSKQHHQERSHLLSLSGLCTTALRTIADSPAWEANRRGLRGPCTLVTRLLNPTLTRREPDAVHGSGTVDRQRVPRFWGQGFTTVRKPSRVYAFRLRGLPGRPKLFAP